MPLVINSLRGKHIDTQTHRHTHAYRHVDQSNFKKPGARGLRLHTAGLKIDNVVLTLCSVEAIEQEIEDSESI